MKALQKALQKRVIQDVPTILKILGEATQESSIYFKSIYQRVTEHSEYVLPRVKVELGSRSVKRPFTNADIVFICR